MSGKICSLNSISLRKKCKTLCTYPNCFSGGGILEGIVTGFNQGFSENCLYKLFYSVFYNKARASVSVKALQVPHLRCLRFSRAVD